MGKNSIGKQNKKERKKRKKEKKKIVFSIRWVYIHPSAKSLTADGNVLTISCQMTAIIITYLRNNIAHYSPRFWEVFRTQNV